MKKIITATLATLGFVSSFGAHAAAANFDATTVDTTECTLLSEDISVNLSNNVHGAYECTGNVIVVATCHEGSSLKSRSVKCQNWGASAGTKLYNDAACDTVGTAQWTFSAAAYQAYVASSQGGSVATIQSNTVCSDAVAVTIGTALTTNYDAVTSIPAGGL